MDERDQKGPMPTHDRQPFMPIFWFGWRVDVPFFVLCVGLSGFMFGRQDWFAGVIAALLAVSVMVQGHYAARRVRNGKPLGSSRSHVES